MQQIFSRRTLARFFLIIGIFAMLVGSFLIWGSLVKISQIVTPIAFFLIFLGVGCAMLALKLNRHSLNIFFVVFFSLTGLFLLIFVLKIIPLSFPRVWPLLSVFSGISLFPAGWSRYRAINVRYVIPSVAFVILGVILLIFSLDIVHLSFAEFVRRWWPLLVLLWGLILVMVSLGIKDAGNSMK